MNSEPTSAPAWATVLVAGGRSLRMGQDKARLAGPDGRELWQDRLALLRDVAEGTVMISCRQEQGFLAESGVPLVFDEGVAGPLGGIVPCLEAMKAERLLVLAVDLPGVTREVLTFLQEAAPAATGAVFRRAGFLEPLVAVYPRSMALSGRRRLEEGALSLQDWIAEAAAQGLMQVLDLPAAWQDALTNVNDPAAWDAWKKRVKLPPRLLRGSPCRSGSRGARRGRRR